MINYGLLGMVIEIFELDAAGFRFLHVMCWVASFSAACPTNALSFNT